MWTFTGTSLGDVTTTPAVADGVVYVSDSAAQVIALSAVTGSELWSYGQAQTSPTVANGVVYVGNLLGQLVALNAASGAVLGGFATGGQIFGTSATVVNGMVYIGSNDGGLYGLGLPGGSAAVQRPVPGLLRPDRALRPAAIVN
jgi:eukaryotic-like serine/threonine-protein kinase